MKKKQEDITIRQAKWYRARLSGFLDQNYKLAENDVHLISALWGLMHKIVIKKSSHP